jgi:hypothetical protein
MSGAFCSKNGKAYRQNHHSVDIGLAILVFSYFFRSVLTSCQSIKKGVFVDAFFFIPFAGEFRDQIAQLKFLVINKPSTYRSIIFGVFTGGRLILRSSTVPMSTPRGARAFEQ